MSSVLKGEHFKRRQGLLRENSPLSGGNTLCTNDPRPDDSDQPVFNTVSPAASELWTVRTPRAAVWSGHAFSPRRAGRPRQPLLSPVTWPLSQHSCQSHYSSDSCPVVNYSTLLLTSAFQIDVFSTFHGFYCVCWAGWLAASNVDGWCFIPGLPFNSVKVVIFVQTIHFFVLGITHFSVFQSVSFRKRWKLITII